MQVVHDSAHFKAGDRGRYEYIELNDYHLKAVSGRPVIMRVFLWDRSYALLAARPASHNSIV